MKKFSILAGIALLASCQPAKEKALYSSEAFTIYPDKVVQGDNVARILSPTHIISNYKSTRSATFSRLIKFKFSINEKDNEMPAGTDHWLIIGDEHQSPVMKFGEGPRTPAVSPGTYLPVNYNYTLRVDMSEVLKQFAEKGYYQSFDGTKIAKVDFKGIYIAGGAEPLSWDFVNLDEKGLKLEDPDADSIFTITVKLNPYNPDDYKDKEWKPSLDLSNKPAYHSDQPLVDALYNLSLEEARKNIESDSTFRTGAKWGGVWTRDISYSIYLAFAYHEPGVAMISLLKKVKNGRIIQDTGSGGAWPVSSDRTVWALAAWEIYKVTGDKDWLRKAYEIISNTLRDDEKVLDDPATHLYKGESSFLDWREQTYPKWMSNMDIYVSENLGTNAIHYQAHIIAAAMAKELGLPVDASASMAAAIKKGINEHLWIAEKGYYGQFLYGRNGITLSPKSETLGEALTVLFDIADAKRAGSILEKMPLTAFGATCVFPQIPGIPPYHNNAIWPFVQSYWNLAAAKAGNEKALNHGLAAIYRAGALFLTNYENMVAETGDYFGTEINSDRMLWSMAGNLAMVHRVFMGMHFETDGIHFAPAIPQNYTGKKTLSNFHYRHAQLTITVTGTGNTIASVKLDGEKSDKAFIPIDLEGSHTIEIEMDNQPFSSSPVNIVQNAFTLPDPQVKLKGQQLAWEPVAGAQEYLIYKNGDSFTTTKNVDYTITDLSVASYKVSAVDRNGFPSFSSEPVLFYPPEALQIIEMENFAGMAKHPFVSFSGKGFSEITVQKNRSIEMNIPVEESGDYWIDFRYANGSGPWNTDNKCALRSLYTNEEYTGTVVFPQRGKDEWSDWGYSNSYRIHLHKGNNRLRLVFEEWNNNMNLETNTAMIDYLRLIRL
ncbi:MAG: glycogen debranching protein [Terrimonas sp.]|nr:glycogen debranching protein [Terrimonas sp.]